MSIPPVPATPVAALEQTLQEYIGHAAFAGKDALHSREYADLTEADLLAAGLPVEAIDAWVGSFALGVRQAAARHLQMQLALLARNGPPVTLRVALRWTLALEAATGRSLSLSDWVNEWWDPDCPALVDDGWLFDAAGFTPAEAAAVCAAGPVDRAALTAMAALRGAGLPDETRLP